MTVFREDLDGAKCDLGTACHRKAGLVGTYFRATGTLELRCRKCGKVVAVFAIASRLTPGVN